MADAKMDGCICYIPKIFSKPHMEVLEWVEGILEEYKGYKLTVRQLYYQIVAKDLIKNNQRSYDRIVNIVGDARLAGVLPWTAFEDRGRSLRGHQTYKNAQEAFIESCDRYKIDLWANQPYRPEVWVEKQALEGVIGEICSELRVDFFATKGYNSLSEQWAAGQRMSRYVQKGQTPIIFHLGDLDPSGWDMTRDNRERLSLFAGVPVTVVRLGLNMDQVRQHEPPPNYVKVNAYGEYADSRAKAYVEEFDTEQSWELDALSPRIIHDIIRENVMRLRDEELWDERMEEEDMDIRFMRGIVDDNFQEDRP